MRTTINIKNVNIQLPQSSTGMLPVGLLASILTSGTKIAKEPQDDGIISINKASDGVYMLTDNQKLIKPDFFGLYKGSKPVYAIVVIDAGKKIAVDLEESEEELCMLEEYKSVGKEFDTRDEAVKDFNGKDNTSALLKENSPAAKYCTERGKHLPSAGEMKLVNKYRELVDAALVMAGGKSFQASWYWTSTQYSSLYSWLLNWSDGSVGGDNKNSNNRVRAFAALA